MTAELDAWVERLASDSLPFDTVVWQALVRLVVLTGPDTHDED